MRASLLPLVAIVVVLTSPVSAQAPVCEWIGQPTLSALRVEVLAPGRMSIVPLAGRRAVVSILGRGAFAVRTHDDDDAIAGTTREPIAIVVSGMQTFAGVATVASGTLVHDLTPRRAGLRGRIEIAEGVRLERVALSCETLGLQSEVSAAPMLTPTPPGPRWLARTRILRMRARPELGAPRVTVSLADRALHPFVERERIEGWVRVEAVFLHAALSGWVPDSEIARIP